MSSSPIPSTGDSRVDAALGRIREKFSYLEDALAVQGHLEKRLSDNIAELQHVMSLHNNALKGHAEFIASHEETLRANEGTLRAYAEADKRHESFRLEHEEWMKHMQDKLDALTSIVMRREGGSEARQS